MSKKITELGKLSIAANTDVLLIVENPSTTPTNKYIEVGDLMDNSGAMALPGLDIDGGIDIGAPIADVDLFVVDDGANGTNRKTEASRLKTYVLAGVTHTPEGTDVLSTGETGGIKFLREDGDGTSSWQTTSAHTPEGTVVLSTGETGGIKFLREDGDNSSSWQGVGDADIIMSTTKKVQQKGSCLQSSTHQGLFL